MTTQKLYRRSFLFLFLFTSFMQLKAQVKIHEKIEIVPKTSSTISMAIGSSRTHSLEIKTSWDADVSARLIVNNPDQIQYSTGSPLEYRLDGIAPNTYGINFQLCVAQLGISQSTLVHLIVLVDDIERINASSRFYGGSENIYQVWLNEVSVWFPVDYYLTLNTRSMGYEGISFLSSRLLAYEGNEEFYPSSDNLVMTISEGAEYVSFYDQVTKSRIGPVCNGTLNDFANVAIAADGSLPPLDGARVVVEVNGWKETHVDSMKVYPSHIILRPNPNQLSIYDESDISVRPYPAWLRMAKIYIDQGASYGTLCQSTYDENYNTVYIYGDTLNDVNIGGQIKFLANEQEPDSAVEVHITAKRTYYTGESTIQFPLDFPITGKDTVSGSTTITVEPCKLVVTVTPAVVHQGDTAHIEVKQKLADGTLADVGPDNWITFEIYNNEFGDTLSTMDLSWQDTWIQTYDEPRALFIATKNSALPDSLNVKILVTANEGTGVGKVMVKKKNGFDHFNISLSRDTLKNREVANITGIAVDGNNKEVAIDSLTPVNLSFMENYQYVDFISAAGDTVDELANVPYSVLRSGQLKVIARGTQVEGPVASITSTKVGVPMASLSNLSSAKLVQASTNSEGFQNSFPKAEMKLVASNDATKLGFCDIILMPEVKVIAVADSIKPYYYPGHIDTTESRTNIKVAVTVSGILYGNPLFPYRVAISSAAIEGSGGHSHTGNRPTGRFINGRDTIGTLYKQTTGDTIRARYQASLFGGKEKVIARLMDLTPAIADSDSVVVRVPNLVLLPESEHIHKVGGTCNHHGPSDHIPDSCRTPDNNHYALRQVIDSLTSIANEWFELDGHVLYVNDLSLKFGGQFDIKGLWNGSHAEHRIGKNSDIQTAYESRLGIWIRDEEGNLYVDENGVVKGNRDFNEICRKRGIGHPLHHPDGESSYHYHLEFP